MVGGWRGKEARLKSNWSIPKRTVWLSSFRLGIPIRFYLSWEYRGSFFLFCIPFKDGTRISDVFRTNGGNLDDHLVLAGKTLLAHHHGQFFGAEYSRGTFSTEKPLGNRTIINPSFDGQRRGLWELLHFRWTVSSCSEEVCSFCTLIRELISFS